MSGDALPAPADLRRAIPLPGEAAGRIAAVRREVTELLTHPAGRLLVVVGPCSVHDSKSALDYADWLRTIRPRYQSRLLLVMRAYVEKPRTRVGWKGMANDPDLDGSGRIDEGMRRSRELLARLAALDVPVATEFVDVLKPRFLADLVSWAAVGARTSESPPHREMASDLPCPVGFKNGTSGALAAAINGVAAAAVPQRFMSIDDHGRVAAVTSAGNAAGHVILRGGTAPNYDRDAVEQAARALESAGLPARVMVDCGHGNSRGDYRQQLTVAHDVAAQLAAGSTRILGVMIESHLHAGTQPLAAGRPLVFGQSVTDACLDRAQTLEALDALYRSRGAHAERSAPAPVTSAR